MFEAILKMLGLQRIPKTAALKAADPVPLLEPWDPKRSRISHKCRFENKIKELTSVVRAVNDDQFSSYIINVSGYKFYFRSSLWVDFVINYGDTWLVRTKLGKLGEYNALRLADDEHENWWRLANAVEEAIEEVKRRDREAQANESMQAMLR